LTNVLGSFFPAVSNPVAVVGAFEHAGISSVVVEKNGEMTAVCKVCRDMATRIRSVAQHAQEAAISDAGEPEPISDTESEEEAQQCENRKRH